MRCLAVADWVVSRCEDGSLEAEHALFDASDVVLVSVGHGFGTREQGYLTSAGTARARLRDAGVTPLLGAEIVEALRPLTELAVTPSIACVADQLGPTEVLQGDLFRAATRSYDGAWLDLAAVARACPLEGAALAMQLVHLALVLDEVRPDAPVRLLHEGEAPRPGQRTWRRVSTAGVKDLARALRATRRPITPRIAESDAALADERIRELQVRAGLASDYRPRLHALASALAQAASAPAEVTVVEADPFEPTPLVDELRAHADMLGGELHVREVAQFLGAMTTRGVSKTALAVLAARAWLASGEVAYARYFARRVVEDATAPRAALIAARELLDSTAPTNESLLPPAVQSRPPAPIAVGEPHEHAPVGASLPPAERVSTPPARPAPSPTSVEVVETMPAPQADAARVRMTELARELARDYRLAYGVTLKTDLAAIEAMQRHLPRRFADANGDERVARKLEAELTRHGALLSEILARALGAYWLDTSSTELGRWAMVVPPRTRVWPVGRVYRFFQRGRTEGDLVAFYTELERAARGG